MTTGLEINQQETKTLSSIHAAAGVESTDESKESKEILRSDSVAANGGADKKLLIYSGHDSTIVPLINALGIHSGITVYGYSLCLLISISIYITYVAILMMVNEFTMIALITLIYIL